MRSALVLLSAALLAVNACGGSNNNMSPSGTNGASVTASVSGSSFSGTRAVLATRSGNIVSVAATNSNNENLGFAVVATAPGTFTIPGAPGQEGNNAFLVSGNVGSPGGWAADYFKGSGTIKIDTLTATSTSGTFSFTLVPTGANATAGNKTISNGKFNVTFTSAAGF